MNPVEICLKKYDFRGRSIKQLKKELNFSKRKINHFIWCSDFIENTSGLLHGSGKCIIKVYNYNPKAKNKNKNKIKKNEVEKDIIVEKVEIEENDYILI